MKILLSAYACEPNHGSEPGVGWHWAMELAGMGHDVWVLTRKNNRSTIEAELARMPSIPNLHFIHYDLPRWARWWKKGNRGVYTYYLLWQWGAYRLAKIVHERERFDRVHHVTFVSVRQPSFMGNLGIPFTFGPVAGGERAPLRLRFGYGVRGFVLDAIRDVMNLMVRFDPLMRRTFRQAKEIYVTSEQSRELIPYRYWNKTRIQLAIGWEESEDGANCRSHDNSPLRILYIGRFLYWKGMHLGLLAFALFLDSHSDARLTMLGKGPDEARWKQLANELGITKQVDWIEWMSRDELPELYARHDALLFPSLHDSGGMVVLEAMAHGLPVVCLDLGGPGVMVDETCGRVVKTAGAGKREIVQALANAMIEIAEDSMLRAYLQKGALNRVSSFSWKSIVRSVYERS